MKAWLEPLGVVAKIYRGGYGGDSTQCGPAASAMMMMATSGAEEKMRRMPQSGMMMMMRGQPYIRPEE
jgi:hypothetical protein